MSVSTLLVEGELDEAILAAVLDIPLTIEAGKCSKYALFPRACVEREKNKNNVCYLRDRDFDHDPPDVISPTVDRKDDKGNIIGWRWSRHEIENYMLEPSVISAALDIPEDEFAEKLIDAARRILFYQAARWTIGSARRSLLPPYKLQTKDKDRDFYLPPKYTDRDSNENWVSKICRDFREDVERSLCDENTKALYLNYSDNLNNAIDTSTSQTLLWFAGKDLMASLFIDGPIGQAENPGDFRARIRDWMINNPEAVMTELIEWRNLLDLLR